MKIFKQVFALLVVMMGVLMVSFGESKIQLTTEVGFHNEIVKMQQNDFDYNIMNDTDEGFKGVLTVTLFLKQGIPDEQFVDAKYITLEKNVTVEKGESIQDKITFNVPDGQYYNTVYYHLKDLHGQTILFQENTDVKFVSGYEKRLIATLGIKQGLFDFLETVSGKYIMAEVIYLNQEDLEISKLVRIPELILTNKALQSLELSSSMVLKNLEAWVRSGGVLVILPSDEAVADMTFGIHVASGETFTKSFGKGRIHVMDRDLSSVNNLSGEGPRNALLSVGDTGIYTSPVDFKRVVNKEDILNAIEVIPYDMTLSMPLLFSILGLLLLLSGPVAYLVVRRTKDPKKAFIFLITVSVSGTLFMTALGYFIGFGRDFISEISIFEYDEVSHVLTGDTFVGFKTNKAKAEFQYKGSGEGDNVFISGYKAYPSSQHDQKRKEIMRLSDRSIGFNSKSDWNMNSFGINTQRLNDQGDMGRISLDGNQATVTYTNIFDEDLSHVALVFGDTYADLGTIKKGETLSKEVTMSKIVTKDGYNLFEGIYKDEKNVRMGFLFNRVLSSGSDKLYRSPLIIGWGHHTKLQDYQLNFDAVATQPLSMYLSGITFTGAGGKKGISENFLYYNIMDNNKIAFTNGMRGDTLSGDGYAVIEYAIPTGLGTSKILIKEPGDYKALGVRLKIYDFETKKWEKIDSEKNIDPSNLKSYMEDSGTLRLRVESDAYQEKILAPKLQVFGGNEQ